MSGLFGVPSAPVVPPPPPPPTLQDPAVQAAVPSAQPSGRASTMLTDPAMQRTAGPDKKQYLSGVKG